jgi:hypothetical protein
MIHDLKPPLNEELLIHYGKRGMKWGVRNVRPDEAERKARFGPKAKKIALGVAAVGGAVAAGYILSRNGDMKISAGGLTDPSSPLYSTMTAGKQAASYTMSNKRAMSTPVSALPSGRKMSTSPAISRAIRSKATSSQSGNILNLGDLNAVREAMNDPNFVWEF